MCDREAAGKRGKLGGADQAEGKAGKAGRRGQGGRKSRENGAVRIRRKEKRKSGALRTGRKERFADSFAAAERTNKTFVLLNTGKSGIDENLPCRPAG